VISMDEVSVTRVLSNLSAVDSRQVASLARQLCTSGACPPNEKLGACRSLHLGETTHTSISRVYALASWWRSLSRAFDRLAMYCHKSGRT
jgi:hypothetical protein